MLTADQPLEFLLISFFFKKELSKRLNGSS